MQNLNNLHVSLFEMVESLSNVVDMISPALQGHHKRVAFIAHTIARKIGMSQKDQNNVVLAALLHDCGALSLKEKLDALNFDAVNPHIHAEIGYHLLKNYRHFNDMSDIIRYHHVSWKGDSLYAKKTDEIPLGSYIIHLADRIDVLIDRKKEILGQVGGIRDTIRMESGNKFDPDLVEVFNDISGSDTFWLKAENISEKGLDAKCFRDIKLDYDEIVGITGLIEKIVDFRSRFTATHSRGVAAVAEELSKIMGLPEDEIKLIRVAGYVHDLGKLAVPVELLEKQGALTKEEFNTVRGHAIHSYNTLKSIKGFETIADMASLHHERLNGKGYPFELKGDELPLGARIIGVADIFTAISEDRPYRKGMHTLQAMKVLQGMAENEEIDPYVVSKLEHSIDKVNAIRIDAQMAAVKEYEEFSSQTEKFTNSLL